MDKAAETLFEKKSDVLMRSNFFELMIPFSKQTLKNKIGEKIFNGIIDEPRVFTYTLYSKLALKRYIKTLSRVKRANPLKVNRNNGKFQENDCILEDTEDIMTQNDYEVYFTYLQALTSQAKIVYLECRNIDMGIENEIGNQRNDIVSKEVLIDRNVVFKPYISLETRKSKHIQKFKYSLMEFYDERIQDMKSKNYCIL